MKWKIVGGVIIVFVIILCSQLPAIEGGGAVVMFIVAIVGAVKYLVLPYYRNRHKKGEQDAKTKE